MEAFLPFFFHGGPFLPSNWFNFVSWMKVTATARQESPSTFQLCRRGTLIRSARWISTLDPAANNRVRQEAFLSNRLSARQHLRPLWTDPDRNRLSDLSVSNPRIPSDSEFRPLLSHLLHLPSNCSLHWGIRPTKAQLASNWLNALNAQRPRLRSALRPPPTGTRNTPQASPLDSPAAFLPSTSRAACLVRFGNFCSF